MYCSEKPTSEFAPPPIILTRFYSYSSVSRATSKTRFISPFKSLQNKIKKPSQMALLFWRRRRDFPQTSQLHTALRASSIVRLLPCGGKNSPPDCFYSPFKSLQNKIKKPSQMALLFWRRRFVALSFPHGVYECFFLQ